MLNVTLYYQVSHPGCEAVKQYLDELSNEISYQPILVDIDTDPILSEEYKNQVPYIVVGPYRLRKEFGKDELRVALLSASERHQQMIDSSDKDYLDRIKRSQNFSGTDKFSYWLSKHYMLVFNLLIFIYCGLPVLAPVMMKVNMQLPAKIIYAVYSPLCHQFPFRSFFLFGKQFYYPRELSGLQVDIYYEEIAEKFDLNIANARTFNGDSFYGYKIALCQRDMAIYGSMLLFGLIFAISGRKIKPLPWYLWLILAILPMGIDGFSQLPSLIINFLPNWLPVRESTPLLRTITGFCFGWFTGWYLYPYIEDSMHATRTIMAKKLAVFNKIRENAGTEQESHAV